MLTTTLGSICWAAFLKMVALLENSPTFHFYIVVRGG